MTEVLVEAGERQLQMLVDTGSLYTWISSKVLEEIE